MNHSVKLGVITMNMAAEVYFEQITHSEHQMFIHLQLTIVFTKRTFYACWSNVC